MKAIRDKYDFVIRPRTFWAGLMCLLLGHAPYRAQQWYRVRVGCERCGIHFSHQWDEPGQ